MGWARRRGAQSPLLALVVVAAVLAGLAGCTQYHGPLTSLGDVDQYLPAVWNANPAQSQVSVDSGIYAMPSRHLLLVHVQIPDTSIASLGPAAVHGAVGVWWVALDDRAPGGGQLQWVPRCGYFTSTHNGPTYDIIGDALAGSGHSSMSRYPLEFNPDDDSVSVALSPQDEIALPHGSGTAPYLPPTSASCAAGALS